MFLGVVARPRPELNFDGKIHIERVCTSRIATRMCTNTSFSHEIPINIMLKNGEWKQLADYENDKWQSKEIIALIAEHYSLTEEIENRLELQYKSHTKGHRHSSKIVTIKNDDIIFSGKYKYVDEAGASRDIQLTDLKLVVRNKKGDLIYEDCSCDSNFMKKAMVRVGEKLRLKFHWIKMHYPIYLVMDNAGGHGDKETVEEYTNMLKERYNIVVIYQTPRSPYTNVLDLGFWTALQSKVEKCHYGRRGNTDSLVASVQETWTSAEMHYQLMRIFDRLKKVLVLIIEGNGGSDEVEKKRGRNFRNLDLWELPPPVVVDNGDGDGNGAAVVATVHAGDEDDSDVEADVVEGGVSDEKTAPIEEVVIDDDVDDDDVLYEGLIAM